MDKYIKKPKKKKINKIPIFFLVIGLYIGWIFVRQQIELKELKEQENILYKQMAELKKEKAQLEEEKNMGNDPKYIEKIARERLKMVKMNEIIYIDTHKSSQN
ncbi:FtsB family cell division protein [Inediibacterium massiliense]|uniref:FtsB family cell division protein n=1 Tax=Inediibacterium massiliense TaxID=1658111 RepID=UPI0006B5AF73|nr:septum formation initiator family protein [Inediibacterium massiliense]